MLGKIFCSTLLLLLVGLGRGLAAGNTSTKLLHAAYPSVGTQSNISLAPGAPISPSNSSLVVRQPRILGDIWNCITDFGNCVDGVVDCIGDPIDCALGALEGCFSDPINCALDAVDSTIDFICPCGFNVYGVICCADEAIGYACEYITGSGCVEAITDRFQVSSTHDLFEHFI